VRVVVRAAEAGGVLAPREDRAHALDLVRGDLLAVARAAQDDAKGARLGDDGLARGDAHGRVVVLGVVRLGSVVDDVVPRLGEVRDDGLLELESRVVSGNVDAHVPHCGAPLGGYRNVSWQRPRPSGPQHREESRANAWRAAVSTRPPSTGPRSPVTTSTATSTVRGSTRTRSPPTARGTGPSAACTTRP